MGCADAVPITLKQVFRRSGEPYAATNGTYWFGEGGTGDPDKGDRPLLYRSKWAEKSERRVRGHAVCLYLSKNPPVRASMPGL